MFIVGGVSFCDFLPRHPPRKPISSRNAGFSEHREVRGLFSASDASFPGVEETPRSQISGSRSEFGFIFSHPPPFALSGPFPRQIGARAAISQ
jgi:hypothetical protein